jgi:hypothetical protein
MESEKVTVRVISDELQMKWAKLLSLLQDETRQGGITWKQSAAAEPGARESSGSYMSSSRDLTYLITKTPDPWQRGYSFEIRDESGEVVGTVNSDETTVNDALQRGLERLWLAITETKSRLNEVLDRAIKDLDPPF